jgi:hypothetical protein
LKGPIGIIAVAG